MTRGILLALFLGFGLLALWHTEYYRQLADIAGIAEETPEGKQLSVFIETLERKHFDENGQLSSRINTDEAFQFNNSPDMLHLVRPKFVLGRDGSTWYGQSQEASTNLSAEQIELRGDVIFHQKENAARIHTQQLVIDNLKKVAYSQAPIELSNERSSTTATGIYIDFDAQTIQLQNHVHTHYQPDRVKPSGR